MKTRTLILIFLIMAVLIIAGSCATDKMAYISKEYEIYGTWVNPNYNMKSNPGKIVFYPNGKFEGYTMDTSTMVGWTADFFITNKWNDSEGNIWYTFIFDVLIQSQYTLAKISNSGKILEWVFSTTDYPKEIDPNTLIYTYGIWNRQ